MEKTLKFRSKVALLLFFLDIHTMGDGHCHPFSIGRVQKKFLLVTIDYFTKWVEAKALKPSQPNKCRSSYERLYVALNFLAWL